MSIILILSQIQENKKATIIYGDYGNHLDLRICYVMIICVQRSVPAWPEESVIFLTYQLGVSPHQ